MLLTFRQPEVTSAPTLSGLTGVEKEIWGWKNEGLSANIKNDGS